MDLDQIFGQTLPCICGKTHRIEPREIVYAEDACAQLPAVCARLNLGRRVAVLADIRTREAAGSEVSEVLLGDGWQVKDVLVRDRANGEWPVCDDETKRGLENQIGDVDWILTVGSGVINDLGKWIAADRQMPYISFATAASMNGYASANVAPTIGGMKTLFYGQPPKAVLSSPRILLDAPQELTSAGLGDVLAKTVSTSDWYMNHFLFNDYYCQRLAALVSDIEPEYLNYPGGLRLRSVEAIGALFRALLLTGVSMTMAETSAPASGGEHLISHTLDMMASIDGTAHDLHGRQVGVGTILTAELYRRVLSTESPGFVEPKGLEDVGFWGVYGDVVVEHYSKKIKRLRLAKEKFFEGDTWDQLRQSLALRLHPPEILRQCLASAGAATRAEHIRCSRERLSEAFRRAHEIRSRFTILDLARLVGILPEAADEIVEAWA
jgi:glycerol-1-phosphate dehydrogenase [NAD(P)+]